MLTTHVAPLIIEDRIRTAEARRLARAARSQRTHSTGAKRLLPAWPFAHPRARVTPR